MLHSAVHGGDVETVELVVDSGADLMCLDDNGGGAVHMASLYGNVPVMQVKTL